MICVVGCNHGIQPRDPDWLGGDTREAAEQKQHFAQLLDKIIIGCEVRFVGEEWGLPDITIAHDLADKHGAMWSNINTSPGDLKQMGIPDDYVKGPYALEQKEMWHRKREHVIFSNIISSKAGAQDLLIICGFDHFEPLAGLLLEVDGVVEPCDYRKLDWYRAGVFPEDDP